jgi:coenzyme F420-reducing hydrogenase gamma subunit
MRKIRIGWFSFTCCEDSTIVFTELMNTHYDEWKKIIDIRSARVLRKKEDMKNLDVSFVEGAIASERDAEKLRKIRKNSKFLIAIGSCACTGLPAGQRNAFKAKLKKEIEPEVKEFNLLKKTVPVKKIVKVDDYVEGCPMNEQIFLSTFDKYIKKLR